MIVRYIKEANRKRLAARQRGRVLGRTFEIGSIPLRPGLDNVLVVSHEASRTGAPILAWNICRQLSGRFNVICLLLGGGEITSHFAADSDVLLGPFDYSMRNPDLMDVFVSQLLERYKIRFAIVNSIESRAVLRPLAMRGVASVLLIHEFLAYSRPREQFLSALAWAGQIVFPARIVRDNASSERTHLAIESAHLVPQGKSVIPVATLDDVPTDRNFDSIRAKVIEAASEPGSLVVLGAGTVQYRKGVDLFISTAAALRRLHPDALVTMIWVGHGFDPEADLHYSAYVQQQIEAADLDRFHMMSETSNFEQVYDMVDALFLPSRLDPLPNVAIDAMSHGLPVICFDNATGVAEILRQGTHTASCIIPDFSIAEAAHKIAQLQSDSDYFEKVSRESRALAAQVFDMPRYIDQLLQIASIAETVGASEKEDIATLLAAPDFNADFYLRAGSTLSREDAIRTFVRHWSSGVDLRRPAPGFDPCRYARSIDNGPGRQPNPLAHDIRAGRPDGPWRTEVIDVSAATSALAPGALRCAVHIHAYYIEMLGDIAARFAACGIPFDVFVSVADAEAAQRARSLLQGLDGKIEIKVVPNLGRDIGPLFSAFGTSLRSYELIGHFHTKKSLGIGNDDASRRWVDFLFGSLLGEQGNAMKRIAGRFADRPDLGLVHADDPHLVGWGKNKEFARSLATRMALGELPEEPPSFPVGTMFWARPAALAPLFDMSLDWSDYPVEPAPYDGSILHAIERLIPLVCEHSGFERATAYAPGLRR